MEESLPEEDRFIGTYPRVLDAKNRVTVPSRWRGKGMEELFAVENRKLGVMNLLPREELTRAGAQALRDPKLTPARAREFRRYLFSQAMACPVDKQGRILLPSEMSGKLGFEEEVVLVGTGERIEVWLPERWQAAAAAQEVAFDQMAEELGF